MTRKEIADELYDLIGSGRYVAKQQIGDLPIEEYEGCEMNFYRAIAGDADLEKIVDTKSKYYQGKETYIISFFGNKIILFAED